MSYYTFFFSFLFLFFSFSLFFFFVEKKGFRPYCSGRFLDNTRCKKFSCLSMVPFHRSECKQRIPLWNQTRLIHPIVQGQYTTLPPSETRFDVANTWGGVPPISLLGTCLNPPYESNGMYHEPSDCSDQASYQERSSIDVAMGTKSEFDPPLEALQSLCSSISSNAFASQTKKSDLHTETLSSCGITSETFEQDSRLPSVAIPRTIASEMWHSSNALARSLETPIQSQDLWRPWDFAE